MSQNELSDSADHPLPILAELLCDRYNAQIDRSGNETSTRVIFILGAGASLSANLPNWKQLQEDVLEVLRVKASDTPDYLREIWKSVQAVTGPWDPGLANEDVFKRLRATLSNDALLAAASRIPSLRKLIQKELTDRLTPQDQPSDFKEVRPLLLFELIAHLLKHKWIDGVISFNFDNLLETSLDNELGRANYDLIISDSRESEEPDPERPWLIKVHGSIGYPSSLRFTPETTGVLSTELEEILGFRVFGNSKRSSSVSVVSIGYSWRDEGFLNWFADRVNEIGSIHVIDLLADVASRLDARLKPPNGNCQSRRTVVNHSFETTVESKSLFPDGRGSRKAPNFFADHYLWAVWQKVEELYPKRRSKKDPNRVKPPLIPIARHLLLCYLFGVRNPDKSLCIQHTRKNRLAAEILLHIAKCKGMVTINSMASIPRIRRYALEKERTDQPLASEIDSFVNNHFVMDYPTQVRETYIAKAKHAYELYQQFNMLLFNSTDEWPATPFEQASMEDSVLSLKSVKHEKFVMGCIDKVLKSPEVEIVPGTDARIPWLLGKCKPIDTYTEFTLLTSKLFDNDKPWTHLLTIAESGQWLIDEPIRTIVTTKPSNNSSQERKILLIATDDRKPENWKIKTSSEDNSPVRDKINESFRVSNGLVLHDAWIPWWKHNRHLTLCFCATEHNKPVDFRGGIYFRRRLKATAISPVFLDHTVIQQGNVPTDIAELFVIFMTYTVRALKEYLSDQRDPQSRQNGNQMGGEKELFCPDPVPMAKEVLNLSKLIFGEPKEGNRPNNASPPMNILSPQQRVQLIAIEISDLVNTLTKKG